SFSSCTLVPPGKEGASEGFCVPPYPHRRTVPALQGRRFFGRTCGWGEFETGQPGRSLSALFCFLAAKRNGVHRSLTPSPFQTRIGVDNQELSTFSEHNGLGGSYDQLQGSGRATLSFSCESSSAPI